MEELDYKKAGVDVPLSDKASRFAGEQCKRTFGNNKAIEVIDPSGYFRGRRRIRRREGYQGFDSFSSGDGNGHKVIFSDAAQRHQDAGRDTVAMAAMDGVVYGYLPTTFTTDLSVASLGEDENSPTFKSVCNIYTGLADAVTDIGAVLFTGETAVVPRLITSPNPKATVKFNMSGVMEFVVDPDKEITGESLQAGQIIMVMREKGQRSNGTSLILKVAEQYFGENFFDNPDAQDYIKAAAVPSALYERFFCHINGWLDAPESDLINVHSISHFTGGGIAEKLGGDILFKKGLSAELTDLWGLSPILKMCGLYGNLSDKVMYETFGCGNGAGAIIDSKDEQSFIRIADNFGLEAQYGGVILQEETPQIIIHSQYKGSCIVFEWI